MNYLILTIIPIFIALLESTLGQFIPFSYVPFVILISVFFFWNVNQTQGLVFLGMGGLMLDLFLNNWVGTTYIVFLFSYLILFLVNTVLDIMTKERRIIAAGIHLILAIVLNYFLILLQDNSLSLFTLNYLVPSVIVSLIVLLLSSIIFRTSSSKSKGLYV